jgi:hypothetical protein
MFPLKQTKSSSQGNDSGLGPEDTNACSMQRQVSSVRRTAATAVFGTDTRFKGTKASIAIAKEQALITKGLIAPHPPEPRHEKEEIVECLKVSGELEPFCTNMYLPILFMSTENN